MFQTVSHIVKDWFWLLPTLLTVAVPLVLTSDRIPYLRDLLYPTDLKRGKDLLNTNSAISNNVNQDEFEAVIDALHSQNVVPQSLLDADISKLGINRQYGEKTFLEAYVVGGTEEPWHAQQDPWNIRDGGDGWWEMLAPYYRVTEALEAQIEEESFPKVKVTLILIVLVVMTTAADYLLI